MIVVDIHNIKELLNIMIEKTGSSDFSQKGIIFDTELNTYFFDSGTGKTFECDSATATVLSHLLNN